MPGLRIYIYKIICFDEFMPTPERLSPAQLLEKPTTLGFMDPDTVNVMGEALTHILPRYVGEFDWHQDGNVTDEIMFDSILPFADIVIGNEYSRSGSIPHQVKFTADIRPAYPGQSQRHTKGWHLDRPHQNGYSVIFSSDLPLEYLTSRSFTGKEMRSARARLLGIWNQLEVFHITDPQIVLFGMKVVMARKNELLMVRKTLHRSQRNPTRSTIPKLFLRASVTPAITDLAEAA